MQDFLAETENRISLTQHLLPILTFYQDVGLPKEHRQNSKYFASG